MKVRLFMKKVIIVMAIIISILSLNKEEVITIPKESIRFRVIANGNTKEDQKIKRRIVTNLSEELKEINNSASINETRNYINKNIPRFQQKIEEILKEYKKENSYTIKYGQNYFPEKSYNGILYKEGEYESLVVSIGEGAGNNFWCVLFPPLCFIEEKENQEYKSIIKEIIEKYF